MYTLYYLPDACSLATQVLLRELDQEFELIHRPPAEHYETVNPVGAVPVLIDGEQVIQEGAAIMIHLLEKHGSAFLPPSGQARTKVLQDLLFANATVHPAYGRLFFIAQHLSDGPEKQAAYAAAAEGVNRLWRIVNEQLANQPFLGGDTFSPADILLTVYSRWGTLFPVGLELGANVERMVMAITGLDSFRQSVAAERIDCAQGA